MISFIEWLVKISIYIDSRLILIPQFKVKD